jgi:hypothetical protein
VIYWVRKGPIELKTGPCVKVSYFEVGDRSLLPFNQKCQQKKSMKRSRLRTLNQAPEFVLSEYLISILD